MKKKNPQPKELISFGGFSKQQSFKNMTQRVVVSPTERHTFISAAIIYTEFRDAIEKIEHVIKNRPHFRGYNKVYEDSCATLLEAINCSDEIHTHLCAYRTKFSTKRLIVEQWANINFRLWSLAIDKEIIET